MICNASKNLDAGIIIEIQNRKYIERLNQNTRQSMVPASLQVQRSQIQRQLSGEFKQPVSQIFIHHVILSVQLGLATHQPPQDWVQTT